MALGLYLHATTLSFLPVLRCFRNVQCRSSKIIFCCRVLAFDSGPGSESAKFYRLQFRLRLHLKRSTPTDSNSGLNSDSEALVTMNANCGEACQDQKIHQYRRKLHYKNGVGALAPGGPFFLGPLENICAPIQK